MFGSSLWQRIVVPVLFLLAVAIFALPAAAKGPTPRETARLAADQIMANQLDPSLYGPALFKKLSANPDSAGPVKALRALGPTLKVNEADVEKLPGGHIYAMVVKHAHGLSVWYLGISTRTKLVEYLEFHVGDDADKTKTASQPKPGTPSAGVPSAGPAAPPASGGTACQKYPDLC